MIVRADGIIDYCNAAAQHCFGYRRDDLVGRPVDDLVPDDLTRHADLRAGFAKHPSRDALRSCRQLRAKRKDGSLFQAETSLIPVETDQGVWVLVSVVDITDRLAEQDRLRNLNSAYLALARMNQAIVRAPDEVALFSETCRIAVELGGYIGAWVGSRGQDSSVKCLARAGTVNDFLTQLTVSTDPDEAEGQGPTGRVLRDGVSLYIQNYSAADMTTPWHALAADFGIKATATLPLRCFNKTVATLTLYSTTPEIFDEEARTWLEDMADNISFALDGFEKVQQLHELAHQRKDLSRQLVAAQEAERTRIAADVHDDSVQALAALGLRMGLLKRQLVDTAPEAAATVEQLLEIVGSVSAGLRDLLFELEPAGEGVSLVDMLEQAAAHIFDDEDVSCSLSVDLTLWDTRSTLSPTDRSQAMRIVKEALLNSRNHGHASEVIIEVAPGPDGVWVKIADNGIGFDVEGSLPAHGHRGLANMFVRAAVSGGTCGITSDSNGTVVRFWMPYDDSAAPWAGPITP